MIDDSVLARVRRELEQLYGERLKAVLLYGSRARGDARPNSDYDIAVVLEGYNDSRGDAERLIGLAGKLFAETGQIVSIFLFAPENLEERTLFMHNLRRDALPRVPVVDRAGVVVALQRQAEAERGGAMSPEAAGLLQRAREDLADGERILALGIARVAGREAYTAAFQAAQALVFEREGRTPKTHSGLHGAFARVARDEPGLGPEFGSLLPDLYKLKHIADYSVTERVVAEQAEEAIARARDLIERIATRLAA